MNNKKINKNTLQKKMGIRNKLTVILAPLFIAAIIILMSITYFQAKNIIVDEAKMR